MAIGKVPRSTHQWLKPLYDFIDALVAAFNLFVLSIASVITGIKTGNYAASFGEIVRVDATGGPFNVTLPAIAAGNAGQRIIVKYLANFNNNVTLVPAGGQTIDGLANFVMPGGGIAVHLTSDGGTNWLVTAIQGYAPSFVDTLIAGRDPVNSANAGSIAAAQLPFSVNPVNNDTTSIGGNVIKYVNALGALIAQTQVLIGVNAAATRASVLNAINNVVDATVVQGTAPITASVLADVVATNLRIRNAAARGGAVAAGNGSGNCALANSITGGGAWTVANLNAAAGKAAGGVAARHSFVWTTEMAVTGFAWELPFTPTGFSFSATAADGTPRDTISDTFAIVGNAIQITPAGATHLANTNIVTLIAWQ